MFGITTATKFFNKVKGDHEQLIEDIADPRAAMNFILSLYHLHEWVWAHWLKGNFAAMKKLGICNEINGFTRWLDKNCPHFALLQQLANGTKHCARVDPTDRVAGFGEGPYGIGPFGAPYLLIDNGEDAGSDRYFVASSVLTEIFEFWEKFFDNHEIRDPDSEEPTASK